MCFCVYDYFYGKFIGKEYGEDKSNIHDLQFILIYFRLWEKDYESKFILLLLNGIKIRFYLLVFFLFDLLLSIFLHFGICRSATFWANLKDKS